MTVEKIESMEWGSCADGDGSVDGIIAIELRDLFEPYLLNTKHCDKIAIVWTNNCNCREHQPSVSLYALQDSINEEMPHMSRVKDWYEPDIVAALEYVREELV